MRKQSSDPCWLKNWATRLIITLTTSSMVLNSGCLFSILTRKFSSHGKDWYWFSQCSLNTDRNGMAGRYRELDGWGQWETLAQKGLSSLVSCGQKRQTLVDSQTNSRWNKSEALGWGGRAQLSVWIIPLQTKITLIKCQARQHTGHKLPELNLKVSPALPEERTDKLQPQLRSTTWTANLISAALLPKSVGESQVLPAWSTNTGFQRGRETDSWLSLKMRTVNENENLIYRNRLGY